jgi:[acyl-carrier-protein] S-malonyltransferase
MSLAFLYPGQGSQSLGMGRFLFDEFKMVRDIFVEASDAISLDIKKLCYDSDDNTLALTENTQPALLTLCMATAEVLKTEFGHTPSITAGHSIGEYSSLCTAQVLPFATAVKAVRLRGESMQAAVPVGQGGMMAVLGLSEKQISFLCSYAEKHSGHSPVQPANFNCDGQIVISGKLDALHWLKDNFKPEVLLENNLITDLSEVRRVKFIPLQVSAPFHCSMMKPAEEKMKLFFDATTFSAATIPVIQNFNAEPVTDAVQLKTNLVQQISGSVKWTQSMLKLKSLGVSKCIEVGNGQVLRGLMKKIDPDFFTVYNTNSMDEIKSILKK